LFDLRKHVVFILDCLF
jgi:hypothetical protein